MVHWHTGEQYKVSMTLLSLVSCIKESPSGWCSSNEPETLYQCVATLLLPHVSVRYQEPMTLGDIQHSLLTYDYIHSSFTFFHNFWSHYRHQKREENSSFGLIENVHRLPVNPSGLCKTLFSKSNYSGHSTRQRRAFTTAMDNFYVC